MTRIAILGGGPAGVGAAWRLRHTGKADVVLYERNPRVGGNAGSFDWGDHRLDYGSHRLHPATDPEIMAEIRGFLGDDLLNRPRHGRIRLLGRWIRFPLKPADLLFHLDPRFALGAAWDSAARLVSKRQSSGEANFATVLGASLGRTICRHFYFPYAVKLWGREPSELSAIQARRRVQASTPAKLVTKVLGTLPGFRKPGGGRVFYPRRGFGAISEAYAAAAAELGAEVHCGTTVAGLVRRDDGGWAVTSREHGEERTTDVDRIWSTIPIPALVRMLRPGAPRDVIDAADGITYRAMILIYGELEVDQFTPFDAHYFPGTDVRITRLSEPKNYAAREEPPGRTVLCAELPCDVGDDVWGMDDEALGDLLRDDLEMSGIPLPRPFARVITRRLPQAYPIYVTGYERPFETLDRYVDSLPGVLTYGRQGLFAHDNTHHALAMAHAAEKCLAADGSFDRTLWRDFRDVFQGHVVED